MSNLRIVMFGAAMRQWGRLNPRCLFEDVPSPAGTELAMMGVARALAARGHDVTVYCDCEAGEYDGVKYLRPELAVPMLASLPVDVLVSWGDVGIFQYEVKATLKVLMQQSAHLGLGPFADKVDRYFAISRFSAKTLLDSDAYADPSTMWVTRNGVFLERFGWYKGEEGWGAPDARLIARDHHHLVWASSPDRGLHHLVDIFPRVRAAVPDARLTICYDFDNAYKAYGERQPGSAFVRWLEKASHLKEMDGVEVVQHISQPKLAELLLSAGMMVYPCDPIRQTETYCIAVNEAMAAGMPVIISDADCLPENYDTAALALSRPIDSGVWAAAIVELMTEDDRYQNRSEQSLQLASQTDVSTIAEDWETFFQEYLSGKETTMDRSLASRIGK